MLQALWELCEKTVDLCKSYLNPTSYNILGWEMNSVLLCLMLCGFYIRNCYRCITRNDHLWEDTGKQAHPRFSAHTLCYSLFFLLKSSLCLHYIEPWLQMKDSRRSGAAAAPASSPPPPNAHGATTEERPGGAKTDHQCQCCAQHLDTTITRQCGAFLKLRCSCTSTCCQTGVKTRSSFWDMSKAFYP